MNLRFTLGVVLVGTCVFGCGKSPKAIKEIEGVAKLTEDDLQKIEEEYQCELPDDYRRFLLRNNGGFPVPDSVSFKEAGRNTASDVFCFHAVASEGTWNSLQWHHKTFSGRIPKNTLPIAHDSCGNLWVLNVGPDHAGSVIFWDHGTYGNFDETDFAAWPVVAKSFQEFIDGLHEYETLPEDAELFSRYALVQKAAEGIPDFDKHSAPDAVWQCAFGEDGNVEMQLVGYEIHAIATHTDGYSQLRSSKGLLESGPPRLPK
jgi:cell wall assembly regulator SMI1